MRTSNTPSVAVERLPLLMTEPATAVIRRVSRATGYELARRFPASGGSDGLPVRRIGHQPRVPRDGLLVYIGTTQAGGACPRVGGEAP
jgi:hypothetical protein